MKKKALTLACAVGAFLCAVSFAHAQSTDTSLEHIVNFDSFIEVKPDATLTVTEHILYNFGDTAKHGIYRDIPLGKVPGNDRTTKVENISVVDEKGVQYISEVSGSGIVHIKIGDPTRLATGEKTYIIRYTVQNAIGYFQNFDEVYWNATGNEWQVPIDAASASIILPKQVDGSLLKVSCYRGTSGSNASCAWNQLSTYKTAGTDPAFTTSAVFGESNLGSGEGLTVALGFPKGIVAGAAPRTLSERVLDFVSTFGPFLIPLLTLIVMSSLWYKKGRDPHGRVSIIAEYDAPDNLTPLQIGEVLRERMSNGDISAEIIYLATKGYLKVTEIEEKGLIFKHGDYLLTKLKEASDLPVYDQKLMDALFVTSEVKLSDLKQEFYKKKYAIQKELGRDLIEKGYFKEDPIKVKTTYWAVGAGVVAFSIFSTSFLALETTLMVSLIISGVIIALFSFIMPRRTQKGFDTKNKIKGLKDYLQVAEKDRINFFNSPEKKPEIFEKLLPYAMVLGVEKAWAKQFEDIYLTPPSWYSGSYGSSFNAAVFASNLSSFSSASSASFAQSGSGSGGGGFSGGGGGGGGGGSW